MIDFVILLERFPYGNIGSSLFFFHKMDKKKKREKKRERERERERQNGAQGQGFSGGGR